MNLQYIALYSGYAIGLIVFHFMGLVIKYAPRIDRIYAKNRTSSLNFGMDTQNWTWVIQLEYKVFFTETDKSIQRNKT